MQDAGKLILRVSLAVLILFHGADKIIHGISWMQEPVAALGLPSWVAYGVYAGEIIAPLFLILGLGTRGAAIIVVLDMVAAVILRDSARAFTVGQDGGWGLELPALYFFGAVAVALLGPGRHRLYGAPRTGREPPGSASTMS